MILNTEIINTFICIVIITIIFYLLNDRNSLFYSTIELCFYSLLWFYGMYSSYTLQCICNYISSIWMNFRSYIRNIISILLLTFCYKRLFIRKIFLGFIIARSTYRIMLEQYKRRIHIRRVSTENEYYNDHDSQSTSSSLQIPQFNEWLAFNDAILFLSSKMQEVRQTKEHNENIITNTNKKYEDYEHPTTKILKPSSPNSEIRESTYESNTSVIGKRVESKIATQSTTQQQFQTVKLLQPTLPNYTTVLNLTTNPHNKRVLDDSSFVSNPNRKLIANFSSYSSSGQTAMNKQSSQEGRLSIINSKRSRNASEDLQDHFSIDFELVSDRFDVNKRKKIKLNSNIGDNQSGRNNTNSFSSQSAVVVPNIRESADIAPTFKFDNLVSSSAAVSTTDSVTTNTNFSLNAIPSITITNSILDNPIGPEQNKSSNETIKDNVNKSKLPIGRPPPSPKSTTSPAPPPFGIGFRATSPTSNQAPKFEMKLPNQEKELIAPKNIFNSNLFNVNDPNFSTSQQQVVNFTNTNSSDIAPTKDNTSSSFVVAPDAIGPFTSINSQSNIPAFNLFQPTAFMNPINPSFVNNNMSGLGQPAFSTGVASNKQKKTKKR